MCVQSKRVNIEGKRVNIEGERVVLRAVEAADIDFMYGLENDIESWGASGTTLPFSHYMLERFVESQAVDIHASRELRLMIETSNNETIGTVDLFEFDPYNHRAGVGIIITAEHRNRGYGREVLGLLEGYVREYLELHQLWCTVESNNTPSLALFRSAGYEVCGVKRDWLRRGNQFQDEVMMQKLL